MINLKILLREEINLKNLVKYNAKNLISSERLSDYWRNIDKNILFSFLALFFLEFFFHFLQHHHWRVKDLIKIFIIISQDI